MGDFLKELTELINKHSIDNLLKIPDFIISKYITDTLVILNNMNDSIYATENDNKTIIIKEDLWSKIRI